MTLLLSTAHKRLLALAGVLCLAALAEINGEVFRLIPLLEAPTGTQFALLVGGTGLLLYGLGGTQRSGLWRNTANRRNHLFLLVLIILIGMGLRTWQLQDTVHFYLDEGNFVGGVLDLQKQNHIKMLGPFNHIAGFTWIYPYLQAGAVQIVGPNLLGIRLVSVFLGTLTIPALYLLARTLFTPRTALIAAALLAVFPPHVHFSRLGLNNIADPFFGVLALAFLARGFKHNRRADYVLAGVMLGLTQYFYEGGRLVYPALVLLWGPVALLAWGGRWRGWALSLLVFALVGGPVYYTLAVWDIPLAVRLDRQRLQADYWIGLLLAPPSSGNLQEYLQKSLLPPLQHFITLPDKGQFYYGGSTALVLPFMLPFLFGGLIVAARRYSVGLGLLLLWLFLTAFGNSLLVDNVWTARFVVSFPALVLLLAVGLAAIQTLLERLPSDKRIRQWVMPLIVVVLGAVHVVYYFGPHLAQYNVQIRPGHDQQDVIFRAQAFPPQTEVLLITDDNDIWLYTLHLLADFWDIDIFAKHFYTPHMLQYNQLDRLRRDVDYAFFVEQDDSETQALLREKFGAAEGTFSPYNVPLEKQFMLFYYVNPRPRLTPEP